MMIGLDLSIAEWKQLHEILSEATHGSKLDEQLLEKIMAKIREEFRRWGVEGK